MTISSVRGLVSFVGVEKLKQLDRNGRAVIYIVEKFKNRGDNWLVKNFLKLDPIITVTFYSVRNSCQALIYQWLATKIVFGIFGSDGIFIMYPKNFERFYEHIKR